MTQSKKDADFESLVSRIAGVTQTMFEIHAKAVPDSSISTHTYYESAKKVLSLKQNILREAVIAKLQEGLM